MKRMASQVGADLEIDGEFWQLENVNELEWFRTRAQNFKGVDFLLDKKDIGIRLWAQMEDKDQKKFERGPGKKIGINFDRLRAKGSE